MTIAENERIAARWVDIWNRRDLEAFDELYAPEFVYHMRFPNQLPGIAGEKQVVTLLHSAFPDLQIITEEIIAGPNSAVVRWTMPCTHLGDFRGKAPTGKHMVQTGIDIISIVNGKITERWDEVNVLRPSTIVL